MHSDLTPARRIVDSKKQKGREAYPGPGNRRMQLSGGTTERGPGAPATAELRSLMRLTDRDLASRKPSVAKACTRDHIRMVTELTFRETEGRMPEYTFDILDFSGIDPEDIEVDLRDNNKKLNEYAGGAAGK
jgi:hypothetical protein